MESSTPVDAVQYGLSLAEYGALVGLLSIACIILAYYLIRSTKRNDELADWFRNYAIKAAENNGKTSSLIESLIHSTSNQSADLKAHLEIQTQQIITELKTMTNELKDKIQTLKHSEK